MHVDLLKEADAIQFRWETRDEMTRIKTEQLESCRLTAFSIEVSPEIDPVVVRFLLHLPNRNFGHKDTDWVIQQIGHIETEDLEIHSNRPGKCNEDIHLWVKPGVKTNENPQAFVPLVARFFFQDILGISLWEIFPRFSVTRIRLYKVSVTDASEEEEDDGIFWWDEARYLLNTCPAFQR